MSEQATNHAMVMDQDAVLAVLSGKKRQVRVPLTMRNTWCNGTSWHKPHFDRVVWDMAFVDLGPSPAGNPGPYLHVSWPYKGDQLGARVYPRFEPGERLLIQEDWATSEQFNGKTASHIHASCLDAGYSRPWAPVIFAADEGKRNWEADMVKGEARSSRHMPTWLSRISLKITDVRIERLGSITKQDIKREAIEWINPPVSGVGMSEADIEELGLQLGFMSNWDERHANLNHKWTANPWVLALTFSP